MIAQWVDILLARPLIILLIASGLALSGALVSQYGFGLMPCILCVYQRVPYVAVIVLTLFGLVIQQEKITKIVLIVSVAAFLVGAGIAFFHVGVEQRWWHGTEKCGATEVTSLEELRAAIMQAPAVRCDEPAFIFMGLSMAGWNVLYSLVLAAGTILIYWKLKKNHG